MSSVIVAVMGAVVLVVLLALVVITRYKVAGPNEAFIITGRRGQKSTDPETGRVSVDNSGQKVVVGGGVFVVPFVQQRFSLDLSSRHLPMAVRGAVTLRGVKANLDGVAIVKVGGSEDAIRAAAQRFLQQQDGIVGFTQEVLSGALRAIVGRMSVEDIIRDRAAFAGQVAEEAEASLSGQGLILDAFQIQDITTEGSYLEDLGRPEAARARQEADIAEANAQRVSEQARPKAAEEIAVAERTLYLRQAEIRVETEAAAASKGTAEADAMHKKADAFARYGDAAVLQMLVEVLPQVVAKAPEPLGAVDKLTVISTDGAGRLPRTVANNVAQGVELLDSVAGVDLASMLKRVTGGRDGSTAPGTTAGATAAAAAASPNGRIEVTEQR
ncbi:SPFH domain-containing protein [Streptomyces sp. NPDC057579]|uniref:SPFH domain-containing protein n=1 Tax=Streptomyces sp. NPDC057579 TaxID=3346172 RepID=UPI0036BADEC2